MFAEEWRNEVTHDSSGRLIDHPLVNVAREQPKASWSLTLSQAKSLQRVAVLMKSTRNAPSCYGYSSIHSLAILHRLIPSTPLHGYEGPAPYAEFLSRYVPLEAQEVAIVGEIEMGVHCSDAHIHK